MDQEQLIKSIEAGEEVSWYTWAPIHKSVDADTGEEPRRFWGIASTEDLDLQGEVVSPEGLDLDYFRSHGYFNDDHKQSPLSKIGRPIKAEIRPEGLYIEGELFKNHKIADEYWQLMQSLDASGVKDRRVGLSIEGKVKRRSGNKIASAWVKDIAITCHPVNTSTFVEVMKALSIINKSNTAAKCSQCAQCACGQKDCDCKALSTVSGNALVPESLDSDEKVAKGLNFDQAVLHVEKQLEVPRQMAEIIARYALNKNKQE